jgi:hypothetical protein
MSFGIIVFILCHVCLSVYFLLNQPITKKDWKWLIPVGVFYIIYNIVAYLVVIPYASSHTNDSIWIVFKIAPPIYGAILSFMLWRAICTYDKLGSKIIVIGAIIFFLSDACVMYEGIIGFGSTDPLFLFTFTWATYPISLTLLSLFEKKIF